MTQYLLSLCRNRSIFVPADKIDEIVDFAFSLGVYPSGGIMYLKGQSGNPLDVDSQNLHLNSPLTFAEGRILATAEGEVTVYDSLVKKGLSPFAALVQINPEILSK